MSSQHFLLLVSLLVLAAAAPAVKAGSQNGKPTLYLVPHTHWEAAVFFTREEYLEMGLSHILSAIHLMQKYPEYKFAIDQAAYIKPFLERYPEEAAAFRKYVKEGRMQIVSGMDVMPDDVKPGGELFVRQVQYGQDYFRNEFGQVCSAAWLLDTFGHHPQMPQLLRQAGFQSFWFSRGVPNDDMPSEFNWRGIDGSTIASFWLPGFYGLFYGPPRDQAGFDAFFKERFSSLDKYARGSERVGLAGADVTDAEQHVPDLARAFNQKADAPFNIRFSSPVEFAALVAKRKDVPTFDFDLNPIFQGTYSSRIELHQMTRQIERSLLTAETLGALSNWLGKKTDDKALWQAWEPLMFNQAHDTASGVMTDPVYEDSVLSYRYSERLAEEMIAERWDTLAAQIDTTGKGTPVIAFNSLGFPRTDAVEVDLGFTEPGVQGVEILDPAGKAVPVQLFAEERYEDGALRRAKARFVAKDIPALGYAVYRAVPSQKPVAAAITGGKVLENEFYKVTVNLKTGQIVSLSDKKSGVEILSGPANVVARQEDKGDIWELYHALDGAMCFAATNKQPVPTQKDSLLSSAFGEKEGAVVQGAVFSEFNVAHPFGSGTYATRVRLYQGVQRVDIHTELVNQERNVRYQALFPTTIKNGRYVQEIPFGAVERPIGVEYPAQNWVDYGDGRRGVALLNAGMPGNLVNDGTLMLSLLRSVDLIGYNEGRPSTSAFEIGVPRSFDYALAPHAGDWREAGVVRQGLAFNAPLIVRKASVHAGKLPKTWGMVTISHPNVVMTAFKPGPGGSIVLRVYESSGVATKGVSIKPAAGVVSAAVTDLLERGGRAVPMKDGAVQLDLHPFEIVTMRLKLR